MAVDPDFVSDGSQGGQDAVFVVPDANGRKARVPAVILVDKTGALASSGGGGGDATAANQATQITAEQAILAKLPAAGTAGTASANVVTVQGIASATPVIVGGAVASGATDSGNPVKVGAVYNSTLPTYTNGQRADAQIGLRGALQTQIMSADGTTGVSAFTNQADGSSNTAVTSLQVFSRGAIFNGSTWDRLVKPNATSRIVSSAATTNATSAKASAGNIFMLTGRNTAATVLYLKIYNKASAPTVGTDTPVQTFALPAAANFVLEWLNGRYFGTGIAYAFTAGSADADTGAVAAGDIVGFNLDYS